MIRARIEAPFHGLVNLRHEKNQQALRRRKERGSLTSTAKWETTTLD